MKITSKALLALATLSAAATYSHAQIVNSKRGLGDTGASYSNLQAINAGWYYTWGTGPANPGTYDANLYPMFWSGPSQSTIDGALARNPNYILGFNEPERSDQANMSVSTAISSWTTISNSTNAYNSAHGTSIKLVSPAVADTGGTTGGQQWLASFMSQATAAGLKVDAVAFHWYDISTPTDPAGAASNFESRVSSYHNSYGLPVFITEFAIHDWSGTYTTAQMIEANRQFLNIVVPWLDAQSWVAGYSWYNWFSDSALYTSSSSGLNPTQMGWTYDGAIKNTTVELSGLATGEHVADLAGGTLTASSTAPTLKYINALGGSSSAQTITSVITGSVDWGLTSTSANWVRIQPFGTLRKNGSNMITLSTSFYNEGTLDVAQGVLRIGSGVSGYGTLLVSSTGDSTGSTARLELAGNINLAHPVTFAQRNDPGASDGIRNVSGLNTLSGPMTITVGGNAARVQSDAGQLTLGGNISTNATSARNFYLQGAGNGIVSGVISDNSSNSAGKINLYKQGTGTWTLTGANSYTGTTSITAGVLRMDAYSATTVASSAIANYTFDNVSGSTVINSGTGGSGMNGTLTGGASIVAGGRFGNALSVSGGSYLNINSSIVSMGNAGFWTMSAWVKTATAGSTILSKSTGGSWASGNSIFYLGDGTGAGAGGIPAGVRYAGGFYEGSTAAASVTDNNWHMVTYVCNGGNYALYVDGVAQTLSSLNSSFGNTDVGSNVRLGYTTDNVAADGTVHLNGMLDSVQFYSTALTAPQIGALYTGTTNTGRLPAGTDVTIASGATLDLNNTAQQVATLNGPAGATVSLGNSGAGQLTLASLNNSSFAGTISGNGALVKNNASTLTLSGTNTYTGPTTVNAGLLLFNPAQSLSSSLTLNGTAKAALTGSGNALNKPVSIGGVAGSWTAQLDVANNALVVATTDATDKSAKLGTLADQIASAKIGGSWNGNGITSSILPANPNFTLALVDNADLNGGGGLASINGTALTPASVIVVPALLGDANLDKSVDLADYDAWFVKVGTGTPFVTSSGDFNQDGNIDLADYDTWFTHVGAAYNLLVAAAPLGVAAVPEPATLAVLAVAAPLLMSRRRRG